MQTSLYIYLSPPLPHLAHSHRASSPAQSGSAASSNKGEHALPVPEAEEALSKNILRTHTHTYIYIYTHTQARPLLRTT